MMHCRAKGPITPGGLAARDAATKRSPISKAFSSIDSVSVAAMWPASSKRIGTSRSASSADGGTFRKPSRFV